MRRVSYTAASSPIGLRTLCWIIVRTEPHRRAWRSMNRSVKPHMDACPFCSLAQGLPAGGTTSLLYEDEKIVAFKDINPSAYRHYLVIPKEHIPSVYQLRKGEEHHALVSHMLKTGQTLMQRDAPAAVKYRFGFHRPPLNSVNHLHLHCLALPYSSWWRSFKYLSLGPFGGYVDVNIVLQKLQVG
ncbi:hypothetical protein KP509_20G078600 [Ceratopteris richardii]|uniref:HIT domain-containing protein n=1 Tax=Ceratopteris richardii TaxID=49495 RepID=A0A8T2SKH8_CERRI|nr:hypothetical protein KP509_20G078600 [Ceratopteris richardii]